MEASEETRYVVYGVGFGPDRIDVIGIMEVCQDDSMSLGIPGGGDFEFFELEEKMSLEEARKALDFWSRSCRLLGLGVRDLADADGTSPDATSVRSIDQVRKDLAKLFDARISASV
jgi:hypothetical protein